MKPTKRPPKERTTAQVNRPRNAEDRQDLQRARLDEQSCVIERPWYRCIGPGLITGAADDDPSGIGTYSQCGAAFGYAQLWLVPVCIPLMIAVQEMCGRVAVVTGEGLASVLKEHYPRWLLYGTVSLLFLANTLNVYADLNVMAASAKMLFGLPFFFWLTMITIVIALLQVFVPYRRYVQILKFSCLALIAYAIVPFMRGSHNDWHAIGINLFIPHWSFKIGFLLTATAFLGTTISPYLFFWQSGETVEEVVAENYADEPGKRKMRVRNSEIRNLRADTATGMVASQLAAFFIMITAAGTLYATGNTSIDTAQDAAKALSPLGSSAVAIFTIGIIGVGFLAIPTLAGSAAYAASETFGWRYGLYRRFNRAPGFYLTVVGVLLIGFAMNFVNRISPVKALVYSAVVNAIVAVPMLVLLLLICNNKRILGTRVNGIWSNVFGWIAFAFMAAASGFFIWATVTGKAS